MADLKISFITTVLNESKTIEALLESLLTQTKMPDEIVIVDGGSSDDTIEKIKKEKLKFKNVKDFKVLVKKGNRASGRNEAIEKASGKIILCSDSGCILDKNWIKNISEPFFNSKIDIVSGFYLPITNNTFQKCLASYTCVMESNVDPNNYLPSSRSIAFKKSAWEKVRGYPERFDTCEDLIFAKKMKKENLVFKFSKDALVYWPQRKNLLEAFKQFFNYAEGDGEGLYFRFQTPFLFARYILGFVLLIFVMRSRLVNLEIAFLFLFFLYLFWSIVKNYKYVKKIDAFFILPTLQLISDIAVLSGTTTGMIKRVFKSLREMI